MLSKERKKELRQKAMALVPSIRIGKNGLSEGLVNEIIKQLKQKKLVKIKMLRAFTDTIDKKAAAELIAEKTGSELVHRAGFVVILNKRAKK